MTHELEKTKKASLKAGGGISAIIPRDIDEAWRLAQILVGARMIPSSYEGRDANETTSKVMIGIQKSLEVGFPPITGLSSIMILNGRPCIWGDGAIALVQNKGKLESMKEWIDGEPLSDEWTAHCRMYRVGQDEPYLKSFSVADAKRAKLWMNPKRQPWMMYPQRMLQMRARAWCIRDGFSDCLSGLSIVEEAQDMPKQDQESDKSFLSDDEPKAIEDQAQDSITDEMIENFKQEQQEHDALQEVLNDDS